MPVLLAFAAAFSNAVNVVTQHVASTAAPHRDKGWRLAVYLVRNPLWLLGAGATVAGFVFQAWALYEGRLSVVQSILVTELVFSLVIGRVWLRRRVRPAAWASACVTSIGLAVFLVMSEPHGGHPRPSPGTWPAWLVTGAIIASLTLGARGRSPRAKGALYATASGITWATMATLLKAVTAEVAAGGLPALVWHGATYGVVLTGLGGTVLTQAALHHGPLSVSQPLMVAVDPTFSILLSVWLFGERFTSDPQKVALGGAAFAAMVIGAIFLSVTSPSYEAPAHEEAPPRAPTAPGASGRDGVRAPT